MAPPRMATVPMKARMTAGDSNASSAARAAFHDQVAAVATAATTDQPAAATAPASRRKFQMASCTLKRVATAVAATTAIFQATVAAVETTQAILSVRIIVPRMKMALPSVPTTTAVLTRTAIRGVFALTHLLAYAWTLAEILPQSANPGHSVLAIAVQP